MFMTSSAAILGTVVLVNGMIDISISSDCDDAMTDIVVGDVK
jgi:hypothetical protein